MGRHLAGHRKWGSFAPGLGVVVGQPTENGNVSQLQRPEFYAPQQPLDKPTAPVTINNLANARTRRDALHVVRAHMKWTRPGWTLRGRRYGGRRVRGAGVLTRRITALRSLVPDSLCEALQNRVDALTTGQDVVGGITDIERQVAALEEQHKRTT